jgi:predicted Zn-dependent protease with MMP-like domain
MKPTPGWDRLETIARREVKDVLNGLAKELRDPASAVRVRYETVPAASTVAEGLGDDLLGLFVGADFASEDQHATLPPQIILFLESLWDYSDGDEAVYREEVRATYLHELGHYLGLDEDEVEERGL